MLYHHPPQNPPQEIGLVVNPTKPKALEAAEVIRKRCLENSIRLIEPSYRGSDDSGYRLLRQFPGAGSVDLEMAESDALITLGGDGTILTAARLIDYAPTPILGVNVGRMGFLAEVTVDHLERALEALLTGDYFLDDRLVLEAEATFENGERIVLRCLNDITLHRPAISGICELDVKIDGKYLGTTQGDGLIVATPTGSTAYSLSCGGPVLTPWITALLLTPISPHTLNLRSVVLDSDNVLEISIRSDTPMILIADGQVGLEVTKKDRITLRKAEQTISLIRIDPPDFFDVLRGKLLWGANNYPESK